MISELCDLTYGKNRKKVLKRKEILLLGVYAAGRGGSHTRRAPSAWYSFVGRQNWVDTNIGGGSRLQGETGRSQQPS